MGRILRLVVAVVAIVSILSGNVEAFNGVPVALSVRPVFGTYAVNLHDEQAGLNLKATTWQVTASTWLPPNVIFTWVGTLPVSKSETFTPTEYLKIGATEFKKANQGGSGGSGRGGGASSSSQKPVEIEFSLLSSNRVEVVWPVNRYFAPMLVGEIDNVRITGSGEKDGKWTTDSETVSQTFGAIGGKLHVYNGWHGVGDISAAASDRYSLIEANLRHYLRPGIALDLGGVYKTMWFPEVRVRATGLWVGVWMEF